MVQKKINLEQQQPCNIKISRQLILAATRPFLKGKTNKLRLTYLLTCFSPFIRAETTIVEFLCSMVLTIKKFYLFIFNDNNEY